MLMPFSNEPYVDFLQDGPRSHMLDAINDVARQLEHTYPLRIGSQRIETPDKITSVCPSAYTQLIGEVSKAGREHADLAMKTASETFQTWSRVDPEARARILAKAAAIMRRRIYELSAWMCYEVGKSWIEAYADVAETIDFLDFYAREMIRLGGSQPVHPFPGEDNELRYIPLGVHVVIPPWNFPLAITAGMTSAAIVTGNTVILKPASTAPIIAAKMAEIFEAAGLPDGVLTYLPGSGRDVGDYLVCHPQTRAIAFTGSMEVGQGIFRKAAQIAPGQRWLKRTILEMGGKDCVVVDETADLDEAAAGVVASAYGFQGQKCSACSRLIAHQDVYGELLDKVVDRAKSLTVGHTASQENLFMGGVIDEVAYESINEYIQIGKGEGRTVLSDGRVPDGGWFVPPTIIADVDRNARIAQEEVFGPVLAVIKAKDFDDGLEIANGTRFGLTGGLYSNDRMRLERARHELHVGNLYFNRKCTGALVAVQPFGGFNMSGTDSKAGGRDYLLLFMQGKSIAEKL